MLTTVSAARILNAFALAQRMGIFVEELLERCTLDELRAWEAKADLDAERRHQ